MKTKHYCFAIVLLMAISSFCFAQQTYTLTVKDKESNTENFPRYNLFYLSKLIADDNLSLEERNKTYFALKHLVNDSTLNIENKKNIINSTKYKNIFMFLKDLENSNDERFKSWFDQDNTKLFDEILKEYPDKDLLQTNLNEIKSDKIKYEDEIKKLDNLSNDLNESYSKANYDSFNKKYKEFYKIFNKYYYFETTVDEYKIRSWNLFIEKLNEKFKNNENIKSNIENIQKHYSEDDFVNIPRELKEEISPFYYKDIKDNYCFRNFETLKKELDFEILRLKEENKNNKEKLKEKLNNFINDFRVFYLTKNPNLTSNDLKKVVNTSNFSVSKEQQIIINSQIQTAQAQTGASGINIPSQSQMIEAMAIFLAKRAKQEAAIWFMDQIRLKMNNPMILDVFPETIKVLDGVENYKVPTFNTTWKYAIAKDFVEMPKNLVNSPWVEKVIIKDSINHARLKQSIDFGYDLNRLMTEQYNYRDIIKYFYINERTKKDEKNNTKDKPNQEINRLIDNSTTLLYIITNELFSIDNIDGKDIYRLLSYEEISGLNQKEFEILIELINLKYGNRLSQYEIIKNLKVEDREKINTWMGNILISLSQFDKIRNDYKNKKDDIKDDLTSKNFYNVWSVLNQMITNLQSNDLFKSKKIQDIKTKIGWVQTGMSVYEHFQNNDYVGAANRTFELIKMMEPSFINEQKYKHYFYDFGGKKKISVNYDGTSFMLKRINSINKDDSPNYDEVFVKLYFLNTDYFCFKIKDSPDSCISTKDLNEFSIISNYTAKNKNERIKLLEELLKKYKNENLKNLSTSLGLDQSQIIQLYNYVQIANTAITIDKKNIDEIFKNMDFNFIKEESLNIINKYNYKYTKQLINLLSFFGDVLTVKDEHQLAGVIDSYALPPTSYKLKRKQPSSIDLNAYVGAFGGMLSSFKSSTVGTQAVYGITAPIGVAFTWSRDGWYDNYGFTVDVVDLGNVVNHYLVKPGEDYAKDVHFSEVFSLGTTFLMGIKNSPFVLSGGFRLQPFNTGKDQNNKVFDAGIFHLGVKIDIPLIHLSGKDF